MAIAGVVLIRAAERTEEPPGFINPLKRPFTGRSLRYNGGWALLFLGLMLCAIFAPLAYLSH